LPQPERWLIRATRRAKDSGIFEGKGESAKRQVSQNPATLGRHLKSVKSGAEVAKQRRDVVQFTRAKKEVENFGK
jgi:hypothetical protein